VLRAVITDIDGTITDDERRLNTRAVGVIRDLVENRVQVVLASGNTACFMDALCRMIGTDGSFIGENGGVYRAGFGHDLKVLGDNGVVKGALDRLKNHFGEKGIGLEVYSPMYRFADQAFARTVPVEEVREVVADMPVMVVDTGFAIHIHPPGITKQVAFERISDDLGIARGLFLAIGDSLNDLEMLQAAGMSATVANGHPRVRRVAGYVSEKKYGDGFIDVVDHFKHYFFAR
jgi:phosphoglycolate phosphatase (TIGR01487 family)